MENYYKRNLPHYQPPAGEFFVTFRLANSLSQKIIESLKEEFKKLKSDDSNADQVRKTYFKDFDTFLDNSKHGKKWLQENDVAQIVADKLHDLDGKKYSLICYCIMPNHVHLLFKLTDRDESRSTSPVTDILKIIKGATARRANQILGRTGSFWQHESYNHFVRNDDERERIVRYILNNPVKAGLVDFWENWKWVYCNETYLPIR